MKLTGTFAEKILKLLLVLGAGCLVAGLRAQTLQGTVEVRGLMGSATYSAAGGAAMPLRAHTAIPIGSLIKTAAGAAVDLSFSHNAGVGAPAAEFHSLPRQIFRPRCNAGGGGGHSALPGRRGPMVGFDKRLSSVSKYQIKVSDGIAEVSGSKVPNQRAGLPSFCWKGALFSFLFRQAGAPVPFELNASSPIYFSPAEGVRPAPVELVREIVLQSKGQLRGR